MRSAKLALALLLVLATRIELTVAQPDGAERSEPAFYRVRNLPAGDTLNVRTTPSARSPEVGELVPGGLIFATGKHSTNGQTEWLEVNFDGNLGWVASRFLVPQTIKQFPDTLAPVAGRCGGWEPAWDVTWSDQRLVFKSPEYLFSEGAESQVENADFVKITTAEGHTTPNILDFASRTSSAKYRLILSDAMCSLAGETPHYQSGLLLVGRNGSSTAYYGCCDPSAEVIIPSGDSN